MMLHSRTEEMLRTKQNKINAVLNEERSTNQETACPQQIIDNHNLIMLQRLICAKLQKWQLKRERNAAFDAFLNEEAAAFKAAGIFAEEVTEPSADTIVNDAEKHYLSCKDTTDDNDKLVAHSVEIQVANDLLLYQSKQEEQERELELELEEEEQLLSEQDEEDAEIPPYIKDKRADEPVDLNDYRFVTSSAESERSLANNNSNNNVDGVLEDHVIEEQEVNVVDAGDVKSTEQEQKETEIDKNVPLKVDDVNRSKETQEIVTLSERELLPHEDYNMYDKSMHLTPINNYEEEKETQVESNKEATKVNAENRMTINPNSRSLTSILSTTSSFAHKSTRNQTAACVIVPLTAEKRKTIVAQRKKSMLAPITTVTANSSIEEEYVQPVTCMSTPILAQNANSSILLPNESSLTEKAVEERPKVSIAPPIDLPSMTITEPISEVVRTALARCRNASVFAELNNTLDTIENDYVTRSHHNKSFHNVEFLLTKEEDERRSLELFEEEEYNQFALQLTTLNTEVQQIYSLIRSWKMDDITEIEEYGRHIIEEQEQFEQRLLNEQISHAEITLNVTRHWRRESTLSSAPLDALGPDSNTNTTLGATLSTFASLKAQRCKIFFNNERRMRAQLDHTEEFERNEVYSTIRQFMQLLRRYENEMECISLQESTFREPIETEYAKWIANLTRIHGSFMSNQLASEESNKRLDIIQDEFDHHQSIFDTYILERMVVERTSQLNTLETRGRSRIADVALKTMAFLHDALIAQHTGMMDVIRKEAERRVEVCEQEVNARAALEHTYSNTMEVIRGNEDDLTCSTAVYRTQFKQNARKSISMYHLHDNNMTNNSTLNGVKENNQDEALDERLTHYGNYNTNKNNNNNNNDDNDDMLMLVQMEHIHRSRCMKQECVTFHFIYTSHCRGIVEAVEESENEQRDEVECEEEVERKLLHKQEQRAIKTVERATKLKEDYVKLNRTYSMRAKLPLSQGNLQAKIIELNKSETRTRERIIVTEHSYRVAMNDERRADRRKSVFGCSIADLDWNRNFDEIKNNEFRPDAKSTEHEPNYVLGISNNHNHNHNHNQSNNNIISFHTPFFQPRANRRGSHSVGGTSVVSFSDFIDNNNNNNMNAEEDDKNNAVDHVGELHNTVMHEGEGDDNNNTKQRHDGNGEMNANEPENNRPSYIVGPDGQTYSAVDAPLSLQTTANKAPLQTSSILQSSLFRRPSMRPYKSQSQMFDSVRTFTSLAPPSESNSFMYTPSHANQVNQEDADKTESKAFIEDMSINKVEKEKDERTQMQVDGNKERSITNRKQEEKQKHHHYSDNNKDDDAEDDEEDENGALTLNEDAHKAHSKLFARQQSFVKTIVVFSEQFRRGMSFSSVNCSVNRDHLESSNMQLLLEEEQEQQEPEKELQQQNSNKSDSGKEELQSQPGEEYLKVISLATELDANGNTLVCSTTEAAALMKEIIIICFNLTLDDTYKMRLRDFYRCCNTMAVRRTELSEETVMSNQNAEYVPQLSSLTLWSSNQFMESLQKHLVESINARRLESSRPCSAEQMEPKPHEAELNMTDHSLYNNSISKKPLLQESRKQHKQQQQRDVMTLEGLHSSRREWITLDDMCTALTLTLVKLHWQEDLQNKEFSSAENSELNASRSPVELKGSYATDELVVTRKLVEYWTWSFLADGVKSLIEEYTKPCSMQLQSLFDMFINVEFMPDRMPYEVFEKFFMKDHSKRFLEQLDEVEKELPYDLHSDNIVKVGVPFVCFASFVRASFHYSSLPSLYGVGNAITNNVNGSSSSNNKSNNTTGANDQKNVNTKESSLNECTTQSKFMSLLQKVSEKLLTPCGIHNTHRLSIINHGCAALTVLNRSYAEFIYFCGTRRKVSRAKDFYQCSEGVARKYLHGLLKTMNECKMEIIGSKYILLLILMSIWMETACQSRTSTSITSLSASKADANVESELDKETRRFEAEVLCLAESFYSITTQQDISRRSLRKACVEVMLSFYVLFVTASSVLPLSSQRAHYAKWFKEFLNCLRREQRKLPSLEQIKDLQEKNEYSNNSSADWSFLTMMHRSVNTHWLSYNANIDALLNFYTLLDQKCKADEQLEKEEEEEQQKQQQQEHDHDHDDDDDDENDKKGKRSTSDKKRGVKERSHSGKKKEKIDTSLRADMYKLSRVHKHRTVVNANSSNANENNNLPKESENMNKEGKANSTTKSDAKRGVRREKTDAEKAAELEGVANFVKTYNLATDTCYTFINAHWTAVKWLRCYVNIATMPTQQTDYTTSQVVTPRSVIEALIQQSDCLLALEQMYSSSLADGNAEEPLLFYQADPWRIRYGEHIETCIFYEENEEDTNKTTPTFVKTHSDDNNNNNNTENNKNNSNNNEMLSDLSTIVATATLTGGAVNNVINVEPAKRYDRRHVQKVKEWQLQQEQTQVNLENDNEQEHELWENLQQMELKSQESSKQPKEIEQRRRKYSLLPLRVPERPAHDNKEKSVMLTSTDTFLPLKGGTITMSNFQICKESNGSVIGKTIELFRELKRSNEDDDDDDNDDNDVDDENENDLNGNMNNTEETEIQREQQRELREDESLGKVNSSEQRFAQEPTCQNSKMTCDEVYENDDNGEHFLPRIENKHIPSSSETSQNKRFVVPHAIKERKTYNQDKFAMPNVSNNEYDNINNVSSSNYTNKCPIQQNAIKEIELPTLMHDSKDDKSQERENVESTTNRQKHFALLPLEKNVLTAQSSNSQLMEEWKKRRDQSTSEGEDRKHKSKSKSKKNNQCNILSDIKSLKNSNKAMEQKVKHKSKGSTFMNSKRQSDSFL